MKIVSKIVSANVSTTSFCELAASSSQNSLPGSSSIAASYSHNSLLGSSFMEVNADMNSNCTEPTCNSAIGSFVWISQAKEDAYDQTPLAENSSYLICSSISNYIFTKISKHDHCSILYVPNHLSPYSHH